jgi:hypothetical protein
MAIYGHMGVIFILCFLNNLEVKDFNIQVFLHNFFYNNLNFNTANHNCYFGVLKYFIK